MTTMAHTWKPSEAQVELLKTIFTERVSPTEPNREQFWKNLTQNISNRESFQTAIDALKTRPKVGLLPPVRTVEMMQDNGFGKTVALPVPPVLPELGTEDGLYRDPANGLLYRLNTPKAKHAWDHPQTIVSVFSKMGTERRLTVNEERVKGTWKRLRAFESRQMLTYNRRQVSGQAPVVEGSKILKDWWMTDQDKMTYKYGICMFCMRGLKDERSVRHNYGPDCAGQRGLPWND